MAIIKKGNLLGASGKFDNLVVSHWKGITYVKSLPYIEKNPNVSEQQSAQRNAFGAANIFASYYRHSLIRHVWNTIACGMTGQNLFVSRNIAVFARGLEFVNFSNLSVSMGRIPLPISINTSIDNSDNSILHICWKDFLDYEITRKDDLLHVFLITQNNPRHALLFRSCAHRTDGHVIINLRNDMIDEVLELYVYFSDPQEEHFSNSEWTEINNINE